MHAAAIAALVSFLIYLPVYLAFIENGLLQVPWADLAFQAFYQGVLTAAVSLARARRAESAVTASRIPAPTPRNSRVRAAMIHGASVRIRHSGIWRVSPCAGGGRGPAVGAA